MSDGPSDGFGIKQMTIALVVVALLLGWAGLANAYDSELNAGPGLDEPNGGRRAAGRFFAQAVIRFVSNAFQYVPDFFSVMKYAFTERIGLVICIGLAIGTVVLFGLFTARLEKSLDQPFKPKR